MSAELRFEGLDQTAVEALGERLAPILKRGDVVFLEGDLGAGKTCFARALVRAYCTDPQQEVPSPTFSLVQIYEPGTTDACPIWHFDFYRIDAPSEIFELGLEEALDDGIALIEWPDRLGRLAPADVLTVRFDSGAGEAIRNIVISGAGDWPNRLAALADEATP